MMKRTFIVALLAPILGITVVPEGRATFDKFNLSRNLDLYYTTVKSDGEYLGMDSIRTGAPSYEYRFTAYNDKGQKQDIIINTTKKLSRGAYLQVLSRGSSGKNWAEVQKREIPPSAQLALNL
ncbi:MULTISPECIES: YxeA family protein [Bacillus]|uniref:YxeA family protein n=1 Tax=Bacillus TaxID=1386 RepID=UPI002540CC13|nr:MULTISPECIES: YxeA family protein [Bacillus]MDK3010857.1 YxeA family protein [Bacillus sp. RB3]MDZ4444525.1 YxeA family protein [Bacillus cereus]WIG14984.1 YxeA family protein [Bacillus thuringiensis]